MNSCGLFYMSSCTFRTVFLLHYEVYETPFILFALATIMSFIKRLSSARGFKMLPIICDLKCPL